MFTGLIEDVGEVRFKSVQGGAGRLSVTTHLPLQGLKVGSSIAVNGACLTVVEKGKGRFLVDVSSETLARTNLGKVDQGDPVNLERPLRLGDRLGGHLVTGHVDGVGRIREMRRQGQFTFFEIEVPARLASLLVAKGSVAVDGISLTVNRCRGRRFSAAVIPFTLKNTNLQHRGLGDKVNIETDMVEKYIQRFLKGRKS